MFALISATVAVLSLCKSRFEVGLGQQLQVNSSRSPMVLDMPSV